MILPNVLFHTWVYFCIYECERSLGLIMGQTPTEHMFYQWAKFLALFHIFKGTPSYLIWHIIITIELKNNWKFPVCMAMQDIKIFGNRAFKLILRTVTISLKIIIHDVIPGSRCNSYFIVLFFLFLWYQ
jgi:hypothetical protein